MLLFFPKILNTIQDVAIKCDKIDWKQMWLDWKQVKLIRLIEGNQPLFYIHWQWNGIKMELVDAVQCGSETDDTNADQMLPSPAQYPYVSGSVWPTGISLEMKLSVSYKTGKDYRYPWGHQTKGWAIGWRRRRNQGLAVAMVWKSRPKVSTLIPQPPPLIQNITPSLHPPPPSTSLW
jgi:hypothetical protein